MYRRFFPIGLAVFDLTVMVATFLVAAAVIIHPIDALTFTRLLSLRIKVQNVIVFTGFLLTWYLIFSLSGLYRSKRLSGGYGQATDVVRSVGLGTLVIYVVSLLMDITFVTPGFIGMFFTAVVSMSVASRLLLRYVLHRARLRGRNLRHLIIAGTDRRAMEFADKVSARRELGYNLLGFVGDGPSSRIEAKGYRLLAGFHHFADFLRENVVDEVIVCLPIPRRYDEAALIVSECGKQGVLVRFFADIFKPGRGRITTDTFDGSPVMTLYSSPVQGMARFLKRAIDVVFTVAILTVVSPVLLIAAFLIEAGSPGPVFFIQDRVGLNKRRFRLYKFRTMVSDAERKQAELEHLNEVTGPVFKIRNDPRITKVGRFLRKTSIDELPQLFNVLKGDMSLVGPRPLPVRDYEGFSEDWHRRRFSVRPGITCLWQVNGRSSLPFDRWMELDMAYIDNWSVWLDLKILLKTVPAVLQGSGAS